MNVLAGLLAALGVTGLVAWLQWRRGAWLDTAEAIGRQTSPGFVLSLPLLATVLLTAAAAIVWAWAIWLLVALVIAWLGMLSSHAVATAGAARPSEILADEPPSPAQVQDQRRGDGDGRERRAS